VTFDPFGGYATRGCLRNVARAKDPQIIRQSEHSSFTTGLDGQSADTVAGQISDPALQERYRAQELARREVQK
jgi:hypothetical protein